MLILILILMLMLIWCDLAVTLQSSTRLQFGQIYIFELLLNSEVNLLSRKCLITVPCLFHLGLVAQAPSWTILTMTIISNQDNQDEHWWSNIISKDDNRGCWGSCTETAAWSLDQKVFVHCPHLIRSANLSMAGSKFCSGAMLNAARRYWHGLPVVIIIYHISSYIDMACLAPVGRPAQASTLYSPPARAPWSCPRWTSNQAPGRIVDFLESAGQWP